MHILEVLCLLYRCIDYKKPVHDDTMVTLNCNILSGGKSVNNAKYITLFYRILLLIIIIIITNDYGPLWG